MMVKNMQKKNIKGVISGSWNDVTLVCACHDNPVEMVIQQGQSLFYACPKYHAENREADERGCNNRLSMDDYMKMLEHLHGVLVEAEMRDERMTLTHYTWKDTKGTQYKVLRHDGNKMVISVLNKRAMNR